MLTSRTLSEDAGLSVVDCLVIGHAFVVEHGDDDSAGVNADSTDEEILDYTGRQSSDPRRFPQHPPRY